MISPELAALIAEGVVEALKLANGQPLTKPDVLKVIEDAMRAASEAKMEKEFPGQTP